MAAIQDLVLTFCPKMHFTQQRRLKLLIPVSSRSERHIGSVWPDLK